MLTNIEGINLIKSYESLRLEAYHCSAGVCTIGWGSTSYQDGSQIFPGDKISLETAETLFEHHLKICEDAISGVIMKPVTSNEFSALSSLCYNIGPQALRKSTLIKYLNEGLEREDIAYEFLKWNKIRTIAKSEDGQEKIVMKPSEGLSKRRSAEKTLFLKQ
jgi:lysozyme